MAAPVAVEIPNGTIGQDYEFVEASGNLDARLTFSVAGQNGKKDDPVQWYRCTIWGKWAESLHDSIGSYGKLNKGRSVFVRGTQTISLYWPKDSGDPKINVDVKVTELQAANWPRDDQDSGYDDEPRQQRGSSNRQQSNRGGNSGRENSGGGGYQQRSSGSRRPSNRNDIDI